MSKTKEPIRVAPPVKAPKVVGESEIRRAREYLRAHTPFSIEQLEGVDVETLFAEHLGSTPECLSVNEIADYLSAEGILRFEAGRLAELQEHAANCEECQQNLRLYRELSGKQSGRFKAISLPLSKEVGVTVHILNDEAVWNLDRPDEEIELVLGMEVLEPASAEIDPETVTLECDQVFSQPIRLKKQERDPSEPGTRFVARLRTYPKPGPEGICDWVEVRGRTMDGMQFATRSLMYFKRET